MSANTVDESTKPGAKAYNPYDKVVQDAVGNIVFMAAGTGVVYWLTSVWLLGAKILFYLFAVMVAFTVLGLIYKTFGVLLLMFSPYMKATAPDWMKHGKFWLVAANIMRWIEALIGCAAIYLLYFHIWKH